MREVPWTDKGLLQHVAVLWDLIHNVNRRGQVPTVQECDGLNPSERRMLR